MRSIALVITILLSTAGGCVATRAMGHRLAMFVEKGLVARHGGRHIMLGTLSRHAWDAPRGRDATTADDHASQLERLIDRVGGMMPCGMMGRMLTRPPDRGGEP
ncbi:MAG: hypothetical protein ACE5F9_06460 [Phycisphaerae bacterium]